METHESLTECQEVILVLENYLRDFNALVEWFRIKWEYEHTPIPQRPTSLAWDVSKTNLTKNKSGKSSPIVSSGRSSPSISGKISPRIFGAKTKSSTSPLPGTEQPIFEEQKENVTKSSGDGVQLISSINKDEAKQLDKVDGCEKLGAGDSVAKSNSISSKPVVPNSNELVDLKITSEIEESNEDCSFNVDNQMLDFQLKVIDSPSEDQKTYDIFRKIGVQSAEKSTSTDDFPKLPPPIKRSAAVKINQESQTDDVDKKLVSAVKAVKVEPNKISKPFGQTRPAYSTALARSATIKTAPPPKPLVKPLVKKPPAKPLKPFIVSKSTTQPMVAPVSRTGLARSKTVGDMKPTTSIYSKSKSVIVSKINSKSTKAETSSSNVKSKPQNSSVALQKKSAKDCSSSAETIVNKGTSYENINASRTNIASSSETLSNETLKKDSLLSDGWLTVKCRSRFKNSNSKPRKSDNVLSWATRFHQVSATASLPTLALLPEASPENHKPPSTPKPKPSESTPRGKLYLKRSHTTLSKITDYPKKTNLSVKQLATREKVEEARKTAAELDSETDEETTKIKEAQDDLASEEEHRQKAQQLSEEEERLTKEIAQLQGLEIEVDTETDGTETDGELQGDTDEIEDLQKSLRNEDEMSLEARYEPMLAGERDQFLVFNLKLKVFSLKIMACFFVSGSLITLRI